MIHRYWRLHVSQDRLIFNFIMLDKFLGGMKKGIFIIILLLVLGVSIYIFLHPTERLEEKPSIQYLSDMKDIDPNLLKIIDEDISTIGVGDIFEFAGYEIKVSKVEFLDYLDFEENGKIIRYKPFIDLGNGVLKEATFLLIHVEYRRVSNISIPVINESIGQGLGGVFLFLFIGPFSGFLEYNPEPNLIWVYPMLQGKYVSWPRDETFNLDRDGMIFISVLEEVDVGWEGEDTLVYIIPKDISSLSIIISLDFSCPLGADHPLCKPGLPLAKVELERSNA